MKKKAPIHQIGYCDACNTPSIPIVMAVKKGQGCYNRACGPCAIENEYNEAWLSDIES